MWCSHRILTGQRFCVVLNVIYANGAFKFAMNLSWLCEFALGIKFVHISNSDSFTICCNSKLMRSSCVMMNCQRYCDKNVISWFCGAFKREYSWNVHRFEPNSFSNDKHVILYIWLDVKWKFVLILNIKIVCVSLIICMTFVVVNRMIDFMTRKIHFNSQKCFIVKRTNKQSEIKIQAQKE